MFTGGLQNERTNFACGQVWFSILDSCLCGRRNLFEKRVSFKGKWQQNLNVDEDIKHRFDGKGYLNILNTLKVVLSTGHLAEMSFDCEQVHTLPSYINDIK